MSSTNKTSLGFNQWILEDKPRMEDFNSDNALMDEKLVSANQRIEAVETSLGNKANKMFPEFYNIPYDPYYQNAPGYHSYYCITQEGIVIVNMSALRITGTVTNQEMIGNLPEGFRPSGYILQYAIVDRYDPTGIRSNGLIRVAPNGSIQFTTSLTSEIRTEHRLIQTSFSFVAAH